MVATDDRISHQNASDIFEGFFRCTERFAEDHCYGLDGDDGGTNYDDDYSIVSYDVRSPTTSLQSNDDDVSVLSRDDVEEDCIREENEENGSMAADDDGDSLSDEEMEALYLKAKSLLVLKQYAAFIKVLKDCQQLLSFQLLKHGNATLLHVLSSQEVAPPEKYLLQTIAQDPTAVELLDANGNSALHLCARALNTSNLRAFFLFLRFSRGSAYQPNNAGDLPLHIVAATGSAGAEKAVAALLEVNPTALTTRGARGRVPLHCAFAEGSGNTKILMEILAAHKEAQLGVIDFDDDGNTPLHAAINHASPCMYEALVTFRDELKEEEIFTSPFLTKNRNGDLPLHSALHLLSVDPRTIYVLLNAAPFAGTCKDSRGRMPVQSATATDLPTNLVIDLLKMDMPIEIGNKLGSIIERQHGYSWWHITIDSNDDGKFSAGISGLLEGATLAELIGLARSVGPDGKTLVIDVASEELKAVLQEKLRFLGRYDVSTSHPPFVQNGVQTFSASAIDPQDKGNASTTLRCYSTLSPFLDEINVRKNHQVSSDFIEDMKASFKANHELDLVPGSAQVIAYAKPELVLKELTGVASFQKSTLSWLIKCNGIIKDVALALQNLHDSGLIHGHLEPSVLGSFSSSDGTTNVWKLMKIGQSVKIGSAMSGDLFSSYFPPESIFEHQKERELHMHTSPKNARERKTSLFSTNPKSPTNTISNLGQVLTKTQKLVPESCLASPAWDAWCLGIIMAQLFLPNESFVLPCSEATDELVMNRLSDFDMSDVEDIVGEVRCLAGKFAADLIGRLLDPNPETRLHSMSKILRHRYFHEPVQPIDPSLTDKKARRTTKFGRRRGHF